ncbi:cell division protein FtsQ/DivIB [Arthrobacter sp. Leaf69]|uniref:cell division protein FtsQ/DivIB n=1 Tax=Arthrobacter sp. Leaf69 TaxID=1736232 RepID=UPI0006FEEE5B|nr:FtsQ-type POTRA domain-containing protein [Arthrobacter sp. Leaf69]KQN86390.1 peptidase S33 [Arthrobacter sp. Leaf69]
MPSTRRPGYTAGARRSPSGNGASGTPDVISASKDSRDSPGSTDRANGPESGTPRAASGPAAGAAAKQAALPARDNVLSFPEPKARRRKRIVVGTIATLAVLVAGIVAGAVYSPVLALQTVSVEGTKLLTAAQIQKALAPLQGKPLPQITDGDVAALLKPLVQVKEVTSQARPPSTLQVKVTERVPVALVKQGKAHQLVDADGVKLSDSADPAAIKLPVIDGGGGTLPKDLFHAITGVLGALPADVLARLSNASAKSVDAVELKLVDGQTIVWGNAGDKELKARVLEALLKVPADPANPVRIYDVSVPRHPVTR